MRPSGRQPDELRPVKMTRNFTRHAEGAVLCEFGSTMVLCTASVEDRVPAFLRGSGLGDHLTDAAAHSGLWRVAWEPRSALGIAVAAGARGLVTR